MGNICAFANSVGAGRPPPSGQDLDGGGTNGVQAPEAHVQREIASQPDCWARALQSAGQAAMVLPGRGERVAVIGCGTSWHIASAIAAAREAAGHGRDRRVHAVRSCQARDYDAVLAVTRSGTTIEVLDALRDLRGRARKIGITADAATPIREVTDQLLVLDYADERSVVQTRFATTVLTVARAHIGHDLAPVVEQARAAVAADLDGRRCSTGGITSSSAAAGRSGSRGRRRSRSRRPRRRGARRTRRSSTGTGRSPPPTRTPWSGCSGSMTTCW